MQMLGSLIPQGMQKSKQHVAYQCVHTHTHTNILYTHIHVNILPVKLENLTTISCSQLQCEAVSEIMVPKKHFILF